MGGFLRCNELNAFVSQSAHVKPFEQSLSTAQQDWRYGDVQFVDETLAKILLDCASLSSEVSGSFLSANYDISSGGWIVCRGFKGPRSTPSKSEKSISVNTMKLNSPDVTAALKFAQTVPTGEDCISQSCSPVPVDRNSAN